MKISENDNEDFSQQETDLLQKEFTDADDIMSFSDPDEAEEYRTELDMARSEAQEDLPDGADEEPVNGEAEEPQEDGEPQEAEEQPEDGDGETQEETAPEETGFIKSLWKNKRRRAKLGYAFVCVVLLAVGTVYGFVNAVLDNIEEDEPNIPSFDTSQLDVIYDENDYELYSAISSATGLNNYVYQWYNWDGNIMSSKNVINVLLLGLDDRHALENGGRSDVMMLASLNTKTKKIHLVSFYRDSWVYFKTPDSREYTNKMNSAYFYGGADCAVQTIEKVFKIKIDHYVTVDFNSFRDIVNAVGGVRVDVQEYESKNMMREWQIECPYGENILLNGKQALYFARQRHCDADSDVSRTRRQRQVITAFIDSCKDASFSQLSDALDKVFKFVRTDLSKSEILNYATRALFNGWVNYDIEQVVISDPSIFRTPTINGVSIVVQDYPKVANIVQNALYGTSNVVLEENRVSIFSLYRDER